MGEQDGQAVDSILSSDQRRSLRCLAAMLIPASHEYGVPSAGDDLIFADILRSIGRDADRVQHLMEKLDTLSCGSFADRDPADRGAILVRLEATAEKELIPLARIILQCYYRDDRVMRSLDMEVRPPFPQGFEVEQGDWSLLDPVRARAPFYRPAP